MERFIGRIRYALGFLFVLLGSLCPTTCRAEWENLTNCEWVANESNDGDSFHVRCEGREYIFRLYFVDAPETALRFPERVAEQATYWDVDVKEALKGGEKAKKYTEDVLKKNFTVYTQWDNAQGSSNLSRYYAIIVTANGDDLASSLVEHGLARIFGMSTTTPKGLTSKQMKEKLEHAERFAQSHQLGLWNDYDEDVEINAALLAAESRTFSCAKTLSVRDERQPNRYIGYLTPGTEISVQKVMPGGVVIRAKLSNGEERECFCNRFELVDAVPDVSL